MTVSGVRTLVVSALAAAVAIRVSGAQTLTGAYARIAADPAASLRSAADGWTVSGTLGDATAQGLRELPLAAWFWLADVVGAPSPVGRTGWCVVVLVLAVVGGVRLGRARSAPAGASRRNCRAGRILEPVGRRFALCLRARAGHHGAALPG